MWAQGNTDTSHGCLNLNGDNAKWFYDFSVPGDVVEVRNTGGPPVTIAQNGDWTVPWDSVAQRQRAAVTLASKASRTAPAPAHRWTDFTLNWNVSGAV